MFKDISKFSPFKTSRIPFWALLLLLVFFMAMAPASGVSALQATPEEIARYSAMLPASPRGIGPTINDRPVWEAIGRQPAFANIITQAERNLTLPLPPWDDNVYLEYSRTGDRTRADRENAEWVDRLAVPVLAEMIENQGRFLPLIERSISAFLDRKTWISPAHENANFTNLKGTFHEADLFSTHAAWVVATIDHWLGGKLPPALRIRLRQVIRNRIFDPYLEILRTGQFSNASPTGWRWITSIGNHNTACTAGVVGAGLVLLEDRQERALLLTGAAKSMPYYLDGFPADGYCSEGLQYWNFGFSSYFLLAETLLDATSGQMNIYNDSRVRRIASYSIFLEMNEGLYPIYSDGTPERNPNVNPNRPWFLDLIQRRLDIGRPDWLLAEPTTTSLSYLYFLSTNAAINRSSPPVPGAGAPPVPLPLRSVFEDSQIYTLRPPGAVSYRSGLGAQNRVFTVSFKGGHNNEYHNHNDVGSFVVGIGRAGVIVDPGREIYTVETFGQHRYHSEINNSFGHSVPLVAGRLQRTGARYAAQIVDEHFTEAEDRVALDLSRAYRISGLTKLLRTFVYNRSGSGSLTVSDEIAFSPDSQPQTFGTALITTGSWQKLASNRLRISSDGASVEVIVESRGVNASNTLNVEALPLDGELASGLHATRIGISFPSPVQSGTIVLTIRPVP